MAAPQILFDESAALTALQQFITTVIPEVQGVDVYLNRPSAVPGKWGLSVVLQPVTPLPVLTSPMGESSVSAQRQLIRLVVLTAAAGEWRANVLGQVGAYTALLGQTTTQVRDGVQAALALLLLPVTLTPTTAGVLPAGQAGLDILADVAGVSMLARFTTVPAGGVGGYTVVDDNLRVADYNWGVWTIRAVVRDVAPAQGPVGCMVNTYCERLRLSMQGQSIPVTNGSAYPYLRDRMGGAASTGAVGAQLNWRQTMGPFEASVLEGATWRTGAALDFEFDTVSALLHDVPSMDALAAYQVITVGEAVP